MKISLRTQVGAGLLDAEDRATQIGAATRGHLSFPRARMSRALKVKKPWRANERHRNYSQRQFVQAEQFNPHGRSLPWCRWSLARLVSFCSDVASAIPL